MMQIDLRRQPHTDGQPADVLVGVGILPADKQYRLLARRCGNGHRVASLVAVPSAPPAEDRLQPEAAAVAERDLRRTARRTRCKMQAVWRGFQ